MQDDGLGVGPLLRSGGWKVYGEPSGVQGWGVAWERRVARDTKLRRGVVGRLLVW